MLPDNPHRPAVELHQCPAPGCPDLLGPSRLFCPDDWDRLPGDVQRAVRAARRTSRAALAHAIASAAAELASHGATR